MAIGVAIPKYVSRSTGGNACCKSAYNARSRILDNHTGEVFIIGQNETGMFFMRYYCLIM